MLKITNLLWYLLYKTGEIAIVNYLFGQFTMRHDILVYGFYSFLSLFQLIFYLSQILPSKPADGPSVTLMRNATLITILMGILSLGAASYYMYQLENDLSTILFIDSVLVMWGVVFYMVHKLLFGVLLQKRQLRYSSLTIWPKLIIILISIGIPIAYLVVKKVVLKKEFNTQDQMLVLIMAGVNALLFLLMNWKDLVRARQAIKFMQGKSSQFPVTDDETIGLLQSALVDKPVTTTSQNASSSEFSDYISQNIRKQQREFGVSQTGEMKTATVITLCYDMDSSTLTAESVISLEEKIIQVVGEYADEYDGYPIFASNRVTLVFGVPFFFEHQRYHALECCTKIVSDLEQYAEQESLGLHVYTGIFSGNVVTGLLPLQGKNRKTYTVVGEGVSKSQQIAEVAVRINKKMLCDADTVEGLRTKFFVEKVYKIKLPDQTEQLVNQIKV